MTWSLMQGISMFFSIKSVLSGPYFIVTANEDFDRKGAREIAIAVTKYCDEKNLKRVLFDFRRAKNVDSVSENFYFAHEDSKEINIDKSMRSALLVHHMDRSHDFVETVLRNTGHNIRKFYDESKAIAWLNGPE